MWTEKIDGTNIRIHWDGEQVRFGGRTERAQIPATLLAKLQDLFPIEKCTDRLSAGVTLYGEGYGAKIQKGGGNYIPDGVNFCLFDVYHHRWFPQQVVRDMASSLEIESAPVVGWGTLAEAKRIAWAPFRSGFGEAWAEGLVLRPKIELCDAWGNRAIGKIKTKDFGVDV